MDNKSDEQLLVIQAKIDVNRQDSGEQLKKLTEYYIAIIT